MEDLQKILFDPNTEEKELERANIEFEKLIQDLEKTTEFQEEKIKEREDWKNTNEPINRDALKQVRETLTNLNKSSFEKFIKKMTKKPVLKLVLMEKEDIMKKHQNDFKFILSNLSLLELRAVFGALPSFRSDQEIQVKLVENLKEKIDEVSKNPPKPKVKKPKPTGGMPPPPPPLTVIKNNNNKSKGGATDTNGLFEELLKKRKQIN